MTNSYMNYEWYLKQDFSKYAGKWLAIIDKKVVAISNDVYKIIKEVKKDYPNKRPLITKITGRLSIR